MKQTMSAPGIVQVTNARHRSLADKEVWRTISLVATIVAAIFLFIRPINAVADQHEAQPQLPTVAMLIDGNPLTVEMAVSGQQRYMGLSFRQTLAADSGMLFVYQAERALTFTMRNTLIPLSIAFISEDMVIKEIIHMNVGPGQLFDSRWPAKYALEVNQGWFEENGIKAGSAIVLQ